MVSNTQVAIDAFNALTDEEKYEFFRSMDSMGGIESYTVGTQIDEFMDYMDEQFEAEFREGEEE